MFDSVFDIFDKGSWTMYILFPLSIYVTALIILKIYQFSAYSGSNVGFIPDVLEGVARKNIAEANNILVHEKGPVARTMQATLDAIYNLQMPENLVKEEAIRAGSFELRVFESHMKILEMSSNIAPLLGLLGTVSGMVRAFAKLELAGARVDPSLLAGGIWEALLATVAGLSIAIPALAATYIFENKIDKIKSEMKDSVTRLILIAEINEGDENAARAKIKVASA